MELHGEKRGIRREGVKGEKELKELALRALIKAKPLCISVFFIKI